MNKYNKTTNYKTKFDFNTIWYGQYFSQYKIGFSILDTIKLTQFQ